MPTVLFLFGLRFFYSEEHLPVHIHVQSGSGKAKINVETGEVMENRGLKPKELKRAVEAVSQYREEIVAAWYEYFDD